LNILRLKKRLRDHGAFRYEAGDLIAVFRAMARETAIKDVTHRREYAPTGWNVVPLEHDGAA
jgi:hypothetical protein